MKASESPGLYVHVPFCRKKCPYCDFYSVAASPARISAWLEAVQREAVLYKGKFSAFDTLYLGGGTPSLLGDRDLAALFDPLFQNFTFASDTEVTIEANPDDIHPEKLKTFKRIGINRLSVGVQSFLQGDLLFLKRRHSVPQTEQALDQIRSAGFANVGVDLMYGFQGQTPDSWLLSLERALAYRPEHISCYLMTIEGTTPFGRLKSRGRLKSLNEEDERAFFLQTSHFLQNHGYIHYEISNFAVDHTHMSRHNQKYWRHTPYLGLGPAAHSFQNGARWWNVRSLEEYCLSVKEGRQPIEGMEMLSAEQRRLESLFLGFRTREGLDLEMIRESNHWEKVLIQLQKSGLIKVEAGKLLPTLEGFVVADSLPLLFSN